jgi:hypothetical protein
LLKRENPLSHKEKSLKYCLFLAFDPLLFRLFYSLLAPLETNPDPSLRSSFPLSNNDTLRSFPYPTQSFRVVSSVGLLLLMVFARFLMDSLTNTLMHPSDEQIWKQAGLFEQVDSLENRPPSFPSKTISNCPASSSIDPVATGTLLSLLYLTDPPPTPAVIHTPQPFQKAPKSLAVEFTLVARYGNLTKKPDV